MNLFITGLVLDTIGEIFIGLAVLMVHRHIMKEHKIDTDVLRTIKKERIVAVAGIFLILVGSLLQIIFYV
ncbi:MAG: hypothetical protein HYY60_00890 [Parcubacteria group bacterium]|nr:hypothetical protein [Candidatus Liptonbacteria bacterium]MBI3019871.1 hypothetical protein [Parcubacteria group bacterium]MBI3075347.1 hypothetical protein [Parcubacteria group bacterium]